MPPDASKKNVKGAPGGKMFAQITGKFPKTASKNPEPRINVDGKERPKNPLNQTLYRAPGGGKKK